MIYSNEARQVLAQSAARLRVCLQHASGDSDGPEEGSDAWLLLHALIGMNNSTFPISTHEMDHYFEARFELSGRWLAEQGGKLDARLQGLQRYIDALASEFQGLFLTPGGADNEAAFRSPQGGVPECERLDKNSATPFSHAENDTVLQPPANPREGRTNSQEGRKENASMSSEQQRLKLLMQATTRLYQLQSSCVLALTRGYQSVMDQDAMERRSLSQQLEQRFLALQRINAVSNSTMDLDQTLEIITKVVAEELHVELCTIFFYDELQSMLTLRATNGPRPLGGMHFTLRLGEGYSGWVADKGAPLLVRDALADPHFSTEVRTYSTEYHGLMAIPVIYFGNVERLIGVISIQSIVPYEFNSSERDFLEVVAGIVAINIENGRLYEQTDEQLRRKVHELATIHRVSSIIASTLNLDEVLQIITTQAVHLSGAERSCIFELDSDKQHLHVVAHYGLNSALVRGLQLGIGQCCAGRAAQTGLPSMAVDCFQNDEHCFLSRDPGISSEIHSVLCVPLQVKRKVLGCICIYSSHRHLLSHEQMQLVITFANEAAIAIENARLYEEARRGLELKSILLRELHHRVKNNLATVAGILSLQLRRTKSPEVRHILAESVNRVQGLAATHDLLSHDDVSEARVDDIARKIVGVANANLRPPETHITFDVQPCPIVIPSRAVTILALVLNEMVSNAIKHGMAGLAKGKVTIRGFEADGIVTIQVIDTGMKLKQYESRAEEINEGLGLSLIKNLIGDLGGKFTLRCTGEDNCAGATVAEVRFPLARPRSQVSGSHSKEGSLQSLHASRMEEEI